MDIEMLKEFEIIDAHTHIFPEKIAENATMNTGKFYDLHMSYIGTSETLSESIKSNGISRCLVCSTATKPYQVQSINNFIAEECAKHPEFIGFGTAHPESETFDDDIQQIYNLGLYGVKIHPDFQTFDMDSPEAYKIYEQIEGKLPVLIHCGDSRFEYSAPRKIANIHRDFPNQKIIAAHLGGYERWDEAYEYLRGLGDNVKFDTSSSIAFMPKENVIKLINGYGVENCFFGTDFPMWHQTEELERFLSLGYGEADNRRMFSLNFKEWMGIE